MPLPDLLKKNGVSPSDIAGIKQGPGGLGKFTSAVIAAAAIVGIGLIVGGVTHILAFVWLSILAAVIVIILGFLGIVFIMKNFPTQSLEGMTLFLDRHPEAFQYLTKGNGDAVGIASVGTSSASENQGLLSQDIDPDSPDAPDKPEISLTVDSGGNA